MAGRFPRVYGQAESDAELEKKADGGATVAWENGFDLVRGQRAGAERRNEGGILNWGRGRHARDSRQPPGKRKPSSEG